MKKFIIIVLVLVLAFAGYITYLNRGNIIKDTAPETETAETAEAPGTEAAESSGAEAPETEAVPEVSTALDFDALYALHQPQDVIMSINGEDVTWGEYFYCLFSQATKMRSSMEQIKQYYGMVSTWADPIDEEGKTRIADLAITNSIEMLKQQKAIETLAADNSVTLTEEDQAKLEEETKSYITQFCGEDATDEQFDEVLKKLYLTRDRFDYINSLNVLYDRLKLELYGENGKKVSDEDAVAYLEENEYLAANHILFMTVDSATREPLDEETAAAKKAKAEEIAAQLQAIEDEEELKTTFAKLKEELCEDTGKTYYPDGYLFKPGTMVAEFEDATKALDFMKVSGPVESSYGYHIIMRLPLDPDMAVELSSDGSAVTARTLVAASRFNSSMQTFMDEAKVEDLNGYLAPDLTQFVK